MLIHGAGNYSIYKIKSDTIEIASAKLFYHTDFKWHLEFSIVEASSTVVLDTEITLSNEILIIFAHNLMEH